MRKQVLNLKYVFNAKSIAIVGASPNPEKLGHVILKNLVEGGFGGKIYPVNPKYKEILGLKCYDNLLSINGKLDLAIIATPAETSIEILTQCAKKGVKGVILLSSGFSEVGNFALEEKIKSIANENEIALIGPNCLGIINPHTRIDSIFMPFYKFQRPFPGSISFITQSGGIGSAIVDIASSYGIGISKFISYGNGAVLNEIDFLEYLGKDPQTKTIIMYLEGTKDGRRLFETLKKVNVKKPIIVLKGGKSERGSEAAKSHTGNLAGNYMAYKSAFKQAKVVEAESLEELFDFVKIFSQPQPKGEKIGIITNGGGIGVLAADAAEQLSMKLAQLSEKSKEELKKILPPYVNIGNPLDLVADADVDRFAKSIEILMNDENIDSLLISVLFQLPNIDERLLKVLIRASEDKRKPIAVVAVGGAYTERQRNILESNKVPTYNSPLAALKALKKLNEYYNCRFCKSKKR